MELQGSSDPISHLQRRIKTLIQDRDEAKDQAARLQKRLAGSQDAWQQRLKEAENTTKAHQTRLKQTLASTAGEAREQAVKEKVKRLTQALVRKRTEQRELNAQKACALERLQEAKRLNLNLERSNAALASEADSVVCPVSTYTQALARVQELESEQRTMTRLLKTQEELVRSQSRQLLDLSTQVRDVRILYEYSVGGTPRSGFRSLQSAQQSPKASRTTVNAKKLRREIKRYQRERNELEIEQGAASQKAAKALKQLIQSKSKALRLLSAG